MPAPRNRRHLPSRHLALIATSHLRRLLPPEFSRVSQTRFPVPKTAAQKQKHRSRRPSSLSFHAHALVPPRQGAPFAPPGATRGRAPFRRSEKNVGPARPSSLAYDDELIVTHRAGAGHKIGRGEPGIGEDPKRASTPRAMLSSMMSRPNRFRSPSRSRKRSTRPSWPCTPFC